MPVPPMYASCVRRFPPNNLRPLALACILVLSIVGVVMAWNATASNPRDGWSWARITLGNTPASPSGDWAFHEVRTVQARVVINPADSASIARVMTIQRRSRFGLFEPWLQTRDLRLLDLSGLERDWQTGTANPQWVQLLQAVREYHAQQFASTTIPDSATYLRRVIAAIDTELAGGFPEQRILWRGLALDVLFILAHLALLVCFYTGIRWVWRQARADHREIRRRCIHCGYDTQGLEAGAALCPECGKPPRPREQSHDDRP